MEENIVNNSGQGKGIEVPHEICRFSWGAFFLSWIWGLGNATYLTLIILPVCLIPLIGGPAALGCQIWFGLKGNEWAWQNKKWDSVEHFHHVQRIWAIVGTALFVFGILLVTALVLPTLLISTDMVKDRTTILKSVSLIQQASLMNNALDKKCELSSEGLASCFGETISKPVNGSKIEDDNSGGVLEFVGDGACANSDACYITIVSGDTNEKIGLYIDEKGRVNANSDDLSKVMNKYSSGK